MFGRFEDFVSGILLSTYFMSFFVSSSNSFHFLLGEICSLHS